MIHHPRIPFPVLLRIAAVTLGAALVLMSACAPHRKMPKAYRKLRDCNCPTSNVTTRGALPQLMSFLTQADSHRLTDGATTQVKAGVATVPPPV
jgi:hypothetical protein